MKALSEDPWGEERLMLAVRRRLVTVAILSVGLTGFLGGPAHAETATTLPLAAAVDVADAGNHVFISGGADSTKIVVASSAGAVRKTIDGLAGPTGLLASTDGKILYAALTKGDAVVAIDGSTLQVIGTYPTGAGTCPSALAQSGHWLYFGYGCAPGQWSSGVGRLDLRRHVPTALSVDGNTYYSAPLLTAGGRILYVGQPGLSPATVTSFQVASNGSVTKLSETDPAKYDLGSNLGDMATTSHGTYVYTASGYPYSIQKFAGADLTTLTTSLPTTAYPLAVALSPDGKMLAGGSNAYYDPDVFLFKDGVPTKSFDISYELIPGGLVWSPNSARLYAVTYDSYYQTPPVLHVLTP